MVKESDFVSKLGLTRVLPTEARTLPIEVSNVNRPGMQFANYWDFFAYERPQLLGKVEMTYMSQLDERVRRERLTKYFSYPLPCIIICRGYPCFDEMLVLAAAHKVPIYSTKKETTQFELELINYLRDYLAPRETRHGVLINVYGTGLLITGNSGVGKSEAALELIRRGHRLVTDDVVEIRKMNNNSLVGTSPKITQYFIELRGIGILDVKTLFGVEAVKEKQTIDLVIKLETWEAEREYDRLGLEEEYTEILGSKIVCHSIPIRPGRNLAVICEAAAINHRQKKMGYNAAQELYKRVQESLVGSQNYDE